ncbi:MAG: hypothetical protein M1838_004499, partial [Thelocarpon superellum]
LIFSSLFDLRKTYFLLAGIAGINPKYGTIGSVAFSKYAVQVALQYEIDVRDLPSNFSTGYIPQGSTVPSEYPQSLYGTEVFEVNDALRQMAITFGETATLADTSDAETYRAQYGVAANGIPAYLSATSNPGILSCDVSTSDVWFSGAELGTAFENTTTLFSNGSATYCMTAQEDNAILEALLRGAVAQVLDFARVIVMRAASDFDRPPPAVSATDNLFYQTQGYGIALVNLYRVGVKVVMGIVNGWEGAGSASGGSNTKAGGNGTATGPGTSGEKNSSTTSFAAGIPPANYIGDMFDTLRPGAGVEEALEPYFE